jgi:NitT/TauT family transport system permease protein/sulfonate transport system permease protein
MFSNLANRTACSSELIILAICVFWWFVAKDLPDFVLPTPIDVLLSTIQIVTDQNTVSHIFISMTRVLVAVLIAAFISILLSVLTRMNILFQTIIENNILVVLNSFPSVGWAILGVIWFSISNGTVIFIEIMIITPFCLINCLQGFRQMDPELLEMGKSFSRNALRNFFKLQIPLAVPFIIAGVRMSYGIAWKIAIVAELFGASSGLGWLLQQAQNQSDAQSVLAICILIVILFSIVDGLLLRPVAKRYSINTMEN